MTDDVIDYLNYATPHQNEAAIAVFTLQQCSHQTKSFKLESQFELV